MVKRKVSIELDTPIEKKKKVSVSSPDEPNGSLDCTDATKLMQSLLGSIDIDEFSKTYWEKKSLFIKRDNPKFYGNLFTLSTMKEILKSNELEYLSDINVCRYVNGEKELLNGEGHMTDKDVDRLIDEKQATFQFHQPQRYVDPLWNIMEKMETFFGSLVGANVYITPPGSQGLAPHCDDVEIFVIQLEGKKTWKFYEPMVQLSRDYTQDLLQESIGEPTMEVTLEPGDMLYFPRGVIHQCNTVSVSHSTHISLSTYQQNTWGDFMNHAVKQAIDKALEDDVTIRSGLPWSFLSILGTGKNMSAYVEEVDGDKQAMKSNLGDQPVKDFKKTVQDHLTKLVDHIDVNTAADSMSIDFMTSRLPPYGHVVNEDDEECVLPTLDDKIKIRYPQHVRIVYCDEDEENREDEDDDDDDDDEEEEMEQEEKPPKSDEETVAKKSAKLPKSPKKATKTSTTDTEEDDEDDEDAVVTDTEPHIKIIHSLNNDRFAHMGGEAIDEEEAFLKLNVTFAKAAIELLNANDFIAVKDLQLEDETDKLTLAATLFSDDLIEIK